MPAEELLDALDPDQREVATALTGPVCVLAGAGTGKTRAITHRIAYGVRTGVYRPTSVLAVTFTARAAGEMRQRLRALGVAGVQARTFHAAALRQLGFFWPKVVGGAPPRLVDAKAPLVAEAGRRVGVTVDRIAVRDLASEVEWAKVSLVAADDYPRLAPAAGRGDVAGADAQAVARLIAAYEDVKTERGVIDFEDVLLLLAAMLAEDRGVAQTVRDQYRHLVVDEYQDVSPLQQYLLDQWLGGRHELCVVGDPAQTIYSFAGASPHHLLDFPRTHPGATLVRLTRDYRSTPQVVTVANRLLVSARRPGDPPTLQLVAQRDPGPQVRFVAYDDDEAEAATVAARCARLVEAGTPASQVAVLFRTNAQSEAFEDALARVGVGYQVRGGERFFARRDVRDAIVLLRGGARAADPDVPMPTTVRDILAGVGWTPEPPATRGAARERWDAMNALVGLADEVAADPTRENPDLRALVAELDERAAAQHAPTVDGVTLASLHAAKGLEWDAVFLAGLSEGLLPISLAETDAAVAEERRLLYVGITRAREHLELSYARHRPGGSATRRRSRFLGPLWPEEEHAGVTVQRADPGLLAALRAWRADVATRDRVPPSAVVADGVLARIASARPTTLARLGAVPGVGPVKLDRYGAALVQVAADFQGDLAAGAPRGEKSVRK